jgi:serine/threonine-protein kinase
LAEVSAGRKKPASPGETVELAWFCQQPYKQLHAAAAGFYAEAFAADAKLAENLAAQHRYSAARAAVLAGTGQGKDADTLDSDERTRWRMQALDWLRADLATWSKGLEGGTPRNRAAVRQAMQRWLADPDFARVRGTALVRITRAEQQEWQKLWDDVAALLKRATDK